MFWVWLVAPKTQFPARHTNAAMEADSKMKLYLEEKYPEFYENVDKEFYSSMQSDYEDGTY